MAVLPKCPKCGMESPEVRCPRCNALKVLGCSGSCALCRDTAACPSKLPKGEPRPSDGAREDPEMMGTPLE